jgi:hypothetical protein
VHFGECVPWYLCPEGARSGYNISSRNSSDRLHTAWPRFFSSLHLQNMQGRKPKYFHMVSVNTEGFWIGHRNYWMGTR